MTRVKVKRSTGLGVAVLFCAGFVTYAMAPLGLSGVAANGPDAVGNASSTATAGQAAEHASNRKSAAAPETLAAGESPHGASIGDPHSDKKWTVKRLVIPEGSEPDWADNSYCYVCHVNFQDEDLSMAHEEVGVGCETCHGMSAKHSEDENNATAPDIMWAEFRINGRCMTCHLRKDLFPGSKASNHESFFARLDRPEKADPGEKYCTQCHAEKHKVPHRTRIWDRETGKLLKQTGGPAMDR